MSRKNDLSKRTKNLVGKTTTKNTQDDGADDFDGSEDGYSDEDSVDEDDESDDDDDDDESDDNESDVNNEDDSDDSFEVQSDDSSSDSSDPDLEEDIDDDESETGDDKERSVITKNAEKSVRQYRDKVISKNVVKQAKKLKESSIDKTNLTELLNTDDVSSDEEDNTNTNTIGRVPLHWYDAYDHIGYNIQGEKMIKRSALSSDGSVKDRIDMAIENRDNIDKMHTVYDMYNDREVVLSARDLEIIQRIQSGTFAHPEHDDTPDYVDYFSSIKEIMPLSKAPLPKSKFLPSKWEMLKVKKILKNMRNGTYKTIAERELEKKNKDNKPYAYNIWNDDDDVDNPDNKISKQRAMYHLPAPKMPMPSHAESYNPPDEYLLTEEEKQDMLALDPTDRQYNFIPQKFSSLRHVSGYSNFVLERFERCLDLYLCPRKLKLRLNIDPETLVPRLPKPRELKPFPNTLCLQYLGHTKAVRSITVSPDGQYLVSGSDDCTVRLWEVDTCLCIHIWTFPNPVLQVAWNPYYSNHVVAVVQGNSVVFVATGTGDRDNTELSDSLFEATRNEATSQSKSKSSQNNEEDSDDSSDKSDDDNDGKKKNQKIKAKWYFFALNNEVQTSSNIKSHKYGYPIGPLLELKFDTAVSSIVWHYKGDYFVTICPQAGSRSVGIHQLSKASTQRPFTKSPGLVQAALFHPSRPFLFVVTQQHIKVYHLIEQKLMKKLLSGCKWLSSVDIHSSGDHIVVGSYDRRMVWFDLDLSSTPYKTLKYHEKAVRQVTFHKKFPLVASASDDGTVHIFHATVYNDMSRNPLIVPLKVLRGHGVIGGMGVLSCVFHPRQPWMFTCGADSVVNLFQDI